MDHHKNNWYVQLTTITGILAWLTTITGIYISMAYHNNWYINKVYHNNWHLSMAYHWYISMAYHTILYIIWFKSTITGIICTLGTAYHNNGYISMFLLESFDV